MPGIGSLVGALAMQVVKESIGNGVIKEAVGEILGIQAAATIEGTVDHVLEKTGIQKELDGKILIKLPFMKSVEKRMQEALAVHPEWKKICAHVYDDSILNETIFYDLEGNEIYKINKTRKNMKHIELLWKGNVIGVVQKKLLVLKNPLSFANLYRYSITLHRKELGFIEIQDHKFRTYGRPNFATWEMHGKNSMKYIVLDEAGNSIAEVWDVSENKYIFDCSNSFDIELLILAFAAFQMREQDERGDSEGLTLIIGDEE